MEIEEFAKKYLNIELKPHQITWLNRLKEGSDDTILLTPRWHGKVRGKRADLVVIDEVMKLD